MRTKQKMRRKSHVKTADLISDASPEQIAKDFEETLLELERFIGANDYGQALVSVIEVLKANLSHASTGTMRSFESLRDADFQHITTRFVACVFRLFSDARWALPADVFREMLPLSSTFHLLVAATPFRDTNHVLKQVLARGQSNMKPEEFFKLCFLWSPYCGIKIEWGLFFKRYPLEISEIVLQALSQFCYLTPESREALDELTSQVANGRVVVEPTPKNLWVFAQAWMFLSYKSSKQKRECKRKLNESARRWALSQGVKEVEKDSYPSRDRPKAIVAIEVMRSNHAMYRAMSGYIASLRDYFEVIGVGFADKVDEKSKALFDSYISLQLDPRRLNSNANIIKKQQADVLIYSSIGMSHQFPVLANLRLAPLQVVLTGHHDSPESEVIDILATEQNSISLPVNSFEKFMPIAGVHWHDLAPHFQTKAAVSRRLASQNNNKVRVAVACSIMKLNSCFLDALEQISARSKNQIVFNFFANCNNVYKNQVAQALSCRTFDFELQPARQYQDYLTALAECDFAISPFPYSNGNGNIDAIKAGLPIVSLRSDELTGQQDYAILKAMTAPDRFCLDSVPSYVERAVQLADSKDFRESETAVVLDILDANDVLDGDLPDFGEKLFDELVNRKSVCPASTLPDLDMESM